MSEVTIRVEAREGTGKGQSRKLRRAGLIPAVVYGGGKDPVPIQVERHTFRELLRKAGGENAIFLLELGDTGKTRHTMIREIDADPITRRIRHIDFQRVVMDQVVRVTVPIEVQGVADGVKNHGGVLDFITRQVDVECLPGNIPQKLLIDVSGLEIGDHRELRHLQVPEGVELMEELDRVVVSVAAPRLEEAEAEEEEVLIEAAVAEPEVIGKGKPDDEEERG
jgi:large subunit ribosomal protein L25